MLTSPCGDEYVLSLSHLTFVNQEELSDDVIDQQAGDIDFEVSAIYDKEVDEPSEDANPY